MSETINFSVRIDKQVKQESEALFQDLGMNLTTAINIFLRQAIRKGGLPFEVKKDQPSTETLLALLEAEKIANNPDASKTYTDVEEALRELKK